LNCQTGINSSSRVSTRVTRVSRTGKTSQAIAIVKPTTIAIARTLRLFAFKLEGDLQLCAVALDLSFVQNHVELGNLGHP
jgi:hypothetical protein